MLVWSLPGEPWNAFESSSRTSHVLLKAQVLVSEEAEMGTWFPKTEVRSRSSTGEALKDLVDQVLALPNEGGEDERFKKYLNKLDELLSLHECFYVASARHRSILSPQDGVFAWNSSQKEELKRLRELLHPKYFSSVQGVDDNARVVQVIFYANAKRDDASDLEKRVLWRVTHLFPVLAFCEIMVACEGTFGAAVAAKSALELLAHFVTGGKAKGKKEGKFDPFSDASKCIYSDLTENIDKKDLYASLCNVVHLRQDSDDKTIKDLCEQVLVAVKTCEALRNPIEVRDDEEILTMKFPLETFSLPTRKIGNFCLVTYRTDYDDQIWPGSHERVDHTMSWSGVSSPRLTKLGFDEVLAHDSPATIKAEELLKLLKVQLEQSEKDTDKQRCYRAIDSLLRTTCIASNLNTSVAIGAIVRELHLTVEKLMMHEKRATEAVNNLDILVDDLDDDLNDFRETVHAALSSFAHPGWLIRTDLLRVHKNSVFEALLLTANYTPLRYGVVLKAGNRTSVRIVDLPHGRHMQESHWRIIAERYPEPIQESLGLGSETTQTGEGFTVPFEAFELCRRALEKLL